MVGKGIKVDLISELLDQSQEEVKKMKPINIMVAGKTGVGKSTLINSLFRENLATTGIGEPITKHLQRIAKKDIPLVLYDTRGLELDQEVQESVKNEIEETLTTNKKFDGERIHLIYYCINANTSRIEPAEIELILLMAKKVPVLIVLTQSIGSKAIEFKEYLEDKKLPVIGIFNVMAQPYPIYETVTIPKSGLTHLIQATFVLIPEENRNAFTNMQQVDIAQKMKRARKWVKKYVISTFSVGFIPIPFSDATLLVPMQITMMAHITAVFGVSMDKATVTALIGAVGGTTSATFLGRYLTANVLKLVPGAGSVVGGSVSGVTAALVTTALGMSYIEILAVMARSEQKGITVSKEDLARLFKQKLGSRLKQGTSNEDFKALLPQFKTTGGSENDNTEVSASGANANEVTVDTIPKHPKRSRRIVLPTPLLKGWDKGLANAVRLAKGLRRKKEK